LAFAWEDAFLLEAQLNNDERMIRDRARGYAPQKLLPRRRRRLPDRKDRSRNL
jgi:glutaryl-CoA dehydrogenase